MGPCLTCYIPKENNLSLSIDIDLILDEITNGNLTRTRKGNHWEVYFNERSFTVSIEKADLEEIINDLIIEKIEPVSLDLDQPIFNLGVCCNVKNKEINNNFVNQFLNHLEKKSIKVIGLIGSNEFNLNL